MADFDALRDTARTAVLPPAEQVRARGHQRTVRTRTAYAGLAGLLVLGGASLAATRGGDGRATLLPGGGTPTASVGATAYPSPVGPGPGIAMDVTRTSADGAAEVEYEVHVTGTAPALWSTTEERFLTGTDVGHWRLSSRAVWGDGTKDEGKTPDAECRPGAPLVPVDSTLSFGGSYAHAGTYTVGLSVTGCGVYEKWTTDAVVTAPGAPAPPDPVGFGLDVSAPSRTGFTWSSLVQGTARQTYAADGTPRDGDQITGWTLAVDGEIVESMGPAPTCRAGAPVVPTSKQLGGTVRQALAPGQHDVALEVDFCDDAGLVSGRIRLASALVTVS